MIHSKSEISKQLLINVGLFHDWVSSQSEGSFEKAPEGKWSTGQHLDHLIKSVLPLNKGLLLPKITFRLMFGKPNREGRNYEGLIKRYGERLQMGGQASGRFVPPQVKLKDKTQLLDQFKSLYKKLDSIIDNWEEEQLDNYILPHPLMGKLTVREMLFFTVYHLEHHRRILEEKYEK